MSKVVIYTKSYCSFCRSAKQLLRSKGFKYEEYDVTHDDKKWREMVKKSGRRTVPQIFIGERHVGGCDDLFSMLF
mgnify:CR=1 FL=1